MNREGAPVDGVGLTEAIESIREDMLAARASGVDAEIQLPVGSITVELQVVAMNGRDGRAGFKVPFVNLELGGSASRQLERTSTVTVVFDSPVDRDGNPVRVVESSSVRKG